MHHTEPENWKTMAAAAAHINTLNHVITRQQTVLDKAAGIIVDALYGDRVDKPRANLCLQAIRGAMVSVGKTTSEHNFETVCIRLAAAAGLPPHTQFHPLHVIDQMRVAIVAQSRNGRYLEMALDSIWNPGTETQQARLITGLDAGGNPVYRYFPPGTVWNEAFDAALVAASAPNVTGPA